jgi:hypothetical protein
VILNKQTRGRAGDHHAAVVDNKKGDREGLEKGKRVYVWEDVCAGVA